MPKTLDEAYDRIFEQIEDEDLPYVNSAMKWLCFEARLHTGEEARVDMQMLAQAVDEDIFGHNFEDELSHDTEVLRELCGCLVTVTPTTLLNGQQRSYVSFAHYTVLEYLASKNRNHPDPFFMLEKEDLVFDKAERIFARSLCVSDAEYEQYEAVTKGEHEYDVCTLPNFGSYCAYTSVDMIICFDDVLSKHEALLLRVLEVLNDEKQHSLTPFSVWSRRAGALMNHREGQNLNWAIIEQIGWETKPDPEMRITIRLLIFGCLHLSKALLERMELQKPFRVYLDFRYHMSYSRSQSFLQGDWHFQGTLTDCFAALFPATSTLWVKADCINVLKLLIETGTGNFDPRGALIAFGPLHDHDSYCGDWCILEKLISLGADPDADGCYITPLQIAVATFDVEGVQILLQAGANPNAEGCAAAPAWPEDTFLYWFNSLNGWRPLEISKQICDIERFHGLKAWSVSDEKDEEAVAIQSSITAMLLEYDTEN